MQLIRDAVCGSIDPSDRVVLAVSGGRDSMTMLDAVCRWRRGSVVAVATFDHGTGAHAVRAVELVGVAAAARGVRFESGRASGLPATEAAWRSARWRFLRSIARDTGACVATGHTSDDQIETVFIRALRGAGARGLAGLLADTDIVRPLISRSRTDIMEYATEQRIDFCDDPSNLSRKFLRNRVRLDLLPACEAARPGFGAELLELSGRAAQWRRNVEARVNALSPRRLGSSLMVDAAGLLEHGEAARALLWPEIAGRAGIVLDRRGTERLAAFCTRTGRVSRVQLAGGHEVVRHARAFEIRPARPLDAVAQERGMT